MDWDDWFERYLGYDLDLDWEWLWVGIAALLVYKAAIYLLNRNKGETTKWSKPNHIRPRKGDKIEFLHPGGAVHVGIADGENRVYHLIELKLTLWRRIIEAIKPEPKKLWFIIICLLGFGSSKCYKTLTMGFPWDLISWESFLTSFLIGYFPFFEYNNQFLYEFIDDVAYGGTLVRINNSDDKRWNPLRPDQIMDNCKRQNGRIESHTAWWFSSHRCDLSCAQDIVNRMRYGR